LQAIRQVYQRENTKVPLTGGTFFFKDRSIGRLGSFKRKICVLHRIFEGHAFRIVVSKPSIGSFRSSEDPKMVDVANMLSRVDVNPQGLM
jgi:hypothetical protein